MLALPGQFLNERSANRQLGLAWKSIRILTRQPLARGRSSLFFPNILKQNIGLPQFPTSRIPERYLKTFMNWLSISICIS